MMAGFDVKAMGISILLFLHAAGRDEEESGWVAMGVTCKPRTHHSRVPHRAGSGSGGFPRLDGGRPSGLLCQEGDQVFFAPHVPRSDHQKPTPPQNAGGAGSLCSHVKRPICAHLATDHCRRHTCSSLAQRVACIVDCPLSNHGASTAPRLI